MADDAFAPPSYTRFDKKQREEFLSQFGITAPSQREVFHQLCSTWRPLIDFDQFVKARAGQFAHPAHEVENLINRLKSARMGIFSYKRNERGERVPAQIILCDEGSNRYWFHFIQDLVQQACENPRNPFLTIGILRTRDILLPVSGIEDFALSGLSRTVMDAQSKTERLVFLSLQTERVLATSQTLGLLLNFASAKLRSILKTPDVTAAASRLLNMGLTDVTKRLEDKESGFWRSLTESLLQHRDDLLADRRLHLDLSFFQSAQLFYSYLTNQIDEAKRLKDLAQEREADMRQIEQLVLQDKEVLMPSAELESHLKLLFQEKYGPEFEPFREEFHNQFSKSSQKTSLPPLIVLRNGVIHRTNLYRYFLRRFDGMASLVWEEYRLKMDHRLRQSDHAEAMVFLNKENLERSLADWTDRTDPLVGELMTKPKLLAEALIHHGKTTLNLNSIEEMKPLMERFFRPGVMLFRTYQEIYALDVATLFETAFKRLSVFSQFWRRLTGKYRIQAEELRPLALPKAKRTASNLAGPQEVPSDEELDTVDWKALSPEERKKMREQWKNRRHAAAGQRKKDTIVPPVIREYTPKERDHAWTTFRKTLKKE